MDDNLKTIEEARQIIAGLAMTEGEVVFAHEVIQGVWDHRSDVQAARRPDFKHRKLRTVISSPRTYEKGA